MDSTRSHLLSLATLTKTVSRLSKFYESDNDKENLDPNPPSTHAAESSPRPRRISLASVVALGSHTFPQWSLSKTPSVSRTLQPSSSEAATIEERTKRKVHCRITLLPDTRSEDEVLANPPCRSLIKLSSTKGAIRAEIDRPPNCASHRFLLVAERTAEDITLMLPPDFAGPVRVSWREGAHAHRRLLRLATGPRFRRAMADGRVRLNESFTGDGEEDEDEVRVRAASGRVRVEIAKDPYKKRRRAEEDVVGAAVLPMQRVLSNTRSVIC